MVSIGKFATGFLTAGMMAALIPFAGSAFAQSKSGVQVGMLECTVAGGIGFIFGSSKSIRCVFNKSGGARERYAGAIRKFGVDIGYTRKSYIAWAVFAPSSVSRGALAGGYVGISAEVTVGAGLGANVLIGGFDNSISLQPVSVQAQTGLNIAAGIGSLSLDYTGR